MKIRGVLGDLKFPHLHIFPACFHGVFVLRRVLKPCGVNIPNRYAGIHSNWTFMQIEFTRAPALLNRDNLAVHTVSYPTLFPTLDEIIFQSAKCMTYAEHVGLRRWTEKNLWLKQQECSCMHRKI